MRRLQPVTSPAKTALCTENTPQGICQANISDPLVDVVPPAGIFSYAKTSPSTGIYVSSIIRQQGFSFSDSITLTPHWIVRVAASQDWTWTDSYTDTAATGYLENPHPRRLYQSGRQPVRKHRSSRAANMTLYATFVDSIQAPDVAAANSGSIVIVNASQAAAAVSQQGRRDRLQAEIAQDQFLDRLVPDGPAFCELYYGRRRTRFAERSRGHRIARPCRSPATNVNYGIEIDAVRQDL